MIDFYKDGGVLLAPRGLTIPSYRFDKVIGDIPTTSFKHVTKRVQNESFGKFPAIFYTGSTNYHSFSLKTIFTSSILEPSSQPFFEILLRSAWEEYKEFEKNILQWREWAVYFGNRSQNFICDIAISNVSMNQNSVSYQDINYSGINPSQDLCDCDLLTFMDYIEVEVSCVEVDDFTERDFVIS